MGFIVDESNDIRKRIPIRPVKGYLTMKADSKKAL